MVMYDGLVGRWRGKLVVGQSRGVGGGGLLLRRRVWCEWFRFCKVVGVIKESNSSASARWSLGSGGLGDCHNLGSDPCRLVHISLVRSDPDVVFPEYRVSVESRGDIWAEPPGWRWTVRNRRWRRGRPSRVGQVGEGRREEGKRRDGGDVAREEVVGAWWIVGKA